MEPLRTNARFPAVRLAAPHYESFYLKACHPSQPLGVWIRYTVHKRPGEPAAGSLWCTLFDAASPGPTAAKATLPPAALGVGTGEYLHIGDSRFEPGRVVGSAPGASPAAWDLAFEPGEPGFGHLPRGWMYRAPIPRTKLCTPYPAVRFHGRLAVGERRIEVDGWPGMVGHNWGTQHAERWVWLQATGFDGHPERSWFDVAVGRVKLGGLVTPWIANGRLVLDGRAYQLGGLGRVRSTSMDERPAGCRFTLTGAGVTVSGRVVAAPRNLVGWVYADPGGGVHHTVNCSISDLTLTVARAGAPPVALIARGAAAYELGMRERDHGVPIQPDPDG